MEHLRYYIAQFLSYTLHPGIMPTVGAILVLGFLPETFEWNFVIRVLLTVFLGTYVGPFLGIVILKVTGVISSVHLKEREERVYPYIIGAVFALFALYICLHQRYGGGEIEHLFIGAIVLGALSWARLELKRHTLQELLSGALLGFVPMFLLLSKWIKSFTHSTCSRHNNWGYLRFL